MLLQWWVARLIGMANAFEARQHRRTAGIRRLRRLSGWTAAAVVVAVAGVSAMVGELLPGRHAVPTTVSGSAGPATGDDGAFTNGDGGGVGPAPAGALPAATSGAS